MTPTKGTSNNGKSCIIAPISLTQEGKYRQPEWVLQSNISENRHHRNDTTLKMISPTGEIWKKEIQDSKLFKKRVSKYQRKPEIGFKKYFPLLYITDLSKLLNSKEKRMFFFPFFFNRRYSLLSSRLPQGILILSIRRLCQ